MAILGTSRARRRAGASGGSWRWLAVLWFCLGWGQAWGQVIPREYQLKAVLLYNLTQFVEWPKGAFESETAPLVVGVLGEDPFGSALDEAVRNERSNNRRLVVKRCTSLEEAGKCALLFVSGNRSKDFPGIVAGLKGRPVLTVADADGFLQSGGMIRLAQTPDSKIRLKINLEEARASGLNISAKLLRVAEVADRKAD
jgi:hypothetical protein